MREKLAVLSSGVITFILFTAVTTAANVPDLNAWLNSNPKVRASIKWVTKANTPLAYTSWSPQQRSDLQASFARAWNDQPSIAADPPNNLFKGTGAEESISVFTEADAWKLYTENIGTSLAIEVGRRVPWSIKTYSSEALDALFAAGITYEWDAKYNGYRIVTEKGHGRFTPSPPHKVLEFLKQNGIITLAKPTVPFIPTPVNPAVVKNAPVRPAIDPNIKVTAPNTKVADNLVTRQTVIAKMFTWNRANTIHFFGGTDAANMLAIYKYNGFPNLRNVLLAASTFTDAYYLPGCRGVSSFLRGMLNTVNIPVTMKNCCGHSCTYFPSETQYLTHGDDLFGTFGSISKWGTPEIPSSEFLISSSKYNQWLGIVTQETFKDSSQCSNVGRQPLELSIKYLTKPMLEKYCESGAKRSTTGPFFKIFSKIYTIEQLDAMGIWAKMDAKIASKGGCSKL